MTITEAQQRLADSHVEHAAFYARLMKDARRPARRAMMAACMDRHINAANDIREKLRYA